MTISGNDCCVDVVEKNRTSHHRQYDIDGAQRCSLDVVVVVVVVVVVFVIVGFMY